MYACVCERKIEERVNKETQLNFFVGFLQIFMPFFFLFTMNDDDDNYEHADIGVLLVVVVVVVVVYPASALGVALLARRI